MAWSSTISDLSVLLDRLMSILSIQKYICVILLGIASSRDFGQQDILQEINYTVSTRLCKIGFSAYNLLVFLLFGSRSSLLFA